MKHLTQKIGTVLVSAGLALSIPAMAGGIPVFDGAAVTQAIQQGIQMAEQIKNQISQIEQLKRQVEAMTSKNNYGSMFNTRAKEELPDEWRDLYTAMGKKGGKDLLAAKKNYDPKAAEANTIKQFDLMLKAARDSEIRMNNLNKLMAEVNRAQDAKAAADLGNRIAIERGIIAKNQANLDTMWRMFEMQKQIDAKQQRKAMACANAKRAGVTVPDC